jgi:hypothetical protein
MGKFGLLRPRRVEATETNGLTRVTLTEFSLSWQKGVTSEPPAKKMAPIASTTTPVTIHQPAAERAPGTIMATPWAGNTRETSSRMKKLNVRCAKLPPSFAKRVSPSLYALSSACLCPLIKMAG